MVVLPDPPAHLPAAPRAFYDGLRAVVEAVRPAQVDAARAEVAFGDGGVAVTLPHRREADWTLAAQVSRSAAVVFAGPATRHFDASGGTGWESRAVELLARALCGDLEVEVVYRGDALVRAGGQPVWSLARLARWRPERAETVRMDFGAHAG